MAPNPSAPDRTHLLDYVRVLHRRRVPALAVFGLFVAGGVLYVWTAVPVYEARVQLMIESERPRVVIFKDTIEQDTDKADYQQTQHKILQSRALAARVLDTLDLWNRPEFSRSPAAAGVVHRVLDPVVSLADRTVSRLSASTATPPKPAAGAAPDESGDHSKAVDEFLRRLTVEPVRNSRLVDVKFQGFDAAVAARVANTLAEAYISQTVDFKSKTSKEASDWLTRQLDEQRKRVIESEAALQKYREQTDAMSTSEREAAVRQKLNELDAAVTRARSERTQKEYVYNQLQEAANDPATLENLPAVVNNPAVQGTKRELSDLQRQEHQLRDTLGARHPDLIKVQRAIELAQARLRAEEEKAVDAARADYLTARAQEENVAMNLEVQKRGSTVLRRKQIEYDALEREAATDRQIFESLLQRAKETGVSTDLLASNVRVVDAADAPRTPISPRKVRDVTLAGGAGLMCGLLAAFFIDYLDKRIKTPDEVKAQLGLPCLGLVPVVTTAHGSVPRPPMLNDPDVPSLFREALGAVRTSILFASAGEATHSLLVTSTGPHEGKTLVAANLAISLAQTGRRVLLVDADLRRPSLDSRFGLPDTATGLSGLDAPEWRACDAICRTAVENLWLLPAGTPPPHPTELLSSERFKSMVESVATAYDWVIIDSPPVMAVTDPVLIAHVTGGVVFVVGAGLTDGPTALNALERLHAANARFVGVVLNRVELERDAFFYSDHYRSEYQQYYGART